MEAMDNSEILKKYFPEITDRQLAQFHSIESVYPEWNDKINVISRKDIGNLFVHHILHSLAIAKAAGFKAGMSVLDFGTGGGFPGIPLAIMFPSVNFTLIDSIGKKLRIVEAAKEAAGLENVIIKHENAIEEKGKYNFIVSRAVMKADEMIKIALKNISREKVDGVRNCFIFLKGGDISEEIKLLDDLKHKDRRLKNCSVWTGRVDEYFSEDYFKEKYIIKVLF